MRMHFTRAPNEQPADVLPLDEIESVLNMTRSMDLRHVFLYTPPRLRVVMALAFAELSMQQFASRAGLPRTTVTAWCQHQAQLPFGAAVRLARVFGVPPVEMFEYWL